MAAPKQRPVVIERPDGSRYAVRSGDDAQRLYPDATILHYEDGTPYGEETPKTARATQPAKPRAPRPKRSWAKAPVTVPASPGQEDSNGAPDQA